MDTLATLATEDQDPLNPNRTASASLGGTGVGGPKNFQAGMTQEQTAEFKKQQLLVNTLQNRIKELECKMAETNNNLQSESTRINDLEALGETREKDTYAVIDDINQTLSEKITRQRLEVKKLAGDEPKPINYDPFYYGVDAYDGDLVDFQARRRITEIKCRLLGLQKAFEDMKDTITVSKSINLGYKIVRMDQLLHATGFASDKRSNADQAMVVTQSNVREPDKVHFPKQEIFQETPDMQSNWAITDNIQQTMYRLEMEFAELLKFVKESDCTASLRALEDLRASVKGLKDSKMDTKVAKHMITEMMMSQDAPLGQRLPPGQNKRGNSFHSDTADRDFVTGEQFTTVVNNLNATMSNLLKRLSQVEESNSGRAGSTSSVVKINGRQASCLGCDRRVTPAGITNRNKNENRLVLPNVPVLPAVSVPQTPVKLRYVMKKCYDIKVNNVVRSVYTVPRSYQRAAYLRGRHGGGGKEEVSETERDADTPPVDAGMTSSYYVQGQDGKLYLGDVKDGTCTFKSFRNFRDSVDFSLCSVDETYHKARQAEIRAKLKATQISTTSIPESHVSATIRFADTKIIHDVDTEDNVANYAKQKERKLSGPFSVLSDSIKKRLSEGSALSSDFETIQDISDEDISGQSGDMPKSE